MRRIVVLAIAVALTFAAANVAIEPAEAKTYYNMRSGHLAVRYTSSDIPSSLRPYISQIEYDLVCGSGYGVRLYLTDLGIDKGLYCNYANWFACYVTTKSDWPRGGRSQTSIANEISLHCLFGVEAMAIEYYYSDLSFWERTLFGR